MLSEEIGPRRPYWQDWQYDWRLRERGLRQWRNRIGYGETWLGRYGAARFMSSSMREEIIKCFEQYCHMTSGLGETMQHEIVRRYFRLHPDRASGVYLEQHPLEQRPYSPPRAERRTSPRWSLPR